MPFVTHTQNGLVYLTSSLLDGCTQIAHGFSTRVGGVSAPPYDTLNLGVSRGDESACVRENYARFCGALGVETRRVTLSQQTHSANVRRVAEADAGMGLWRRRAYREVDALITDVPELPLTVFSADCGTLLLWDPAGRSVGAVHAGWRGCAAGIAERTVSDMVRFYGADPARLLAAVGPCIGPCCFETDSDVPEAMRAALGAEAEPYLSRRGRKWHVDLAGLNRLWLLRSGVLPEHIDLCGLCTACRPELFWSHRKMGDARGAQAAMIAVKFSGPMEEDL